MIANPLVTQLLLIIGFFLLFVGIKTPGYGMEIVGALMIAASAVGLGIIGVDLAALAFIAIGFALMLAELKTHIGMLALLGSLSIVIGGLMLIPSSRLWLSEKEFRRMWLSTLMVGGLLASIFGLLVIKAAKAQPHRGRR